ncbi:MAG TPA: ABC transporter permease [Phycisphaerales bacterium]|nr:ABC transporter permease [Phycisphaerales bacterium]
MTPIISLALKDVRLLVRDKGGLFFTFIMPILFGIFFGSIFGGGGGDNPKGVPVVLVDQDNSDRSHQFAEVIRKAEEFKITDGTIEQASDLVRQGKQTAYILIPKGYGGNGTFFFGQPSELEVGVDPARKIEAAMIQGIVTKYAFQQFGEIFTDPTAMLDSVKRARTSLEASTKLSAGQKGILSSLFGSLDTFANQLPELQKNETGAKDEGGAKDAKEAGGAEEEKPGRSFEPVRVTVKEVTKPVETGKPEQPKSAYSVSFPQAMIWAVIGCAASFGISLVTERAKGTLLRLRAAPLSWSGILAGKALACFIMTMASMSLLLIIGIAAFHVRPGSMPLLLLGMVCTSACFVGIMMLLSVLGRTEASAGGIGWAACLVMSMLGGGMVPLFAMPSWMQSMASVSPVKWAILSLEGAIWRGFSLGEMMLPCAILLAVGIGGFAIGSAAFRRLEPS